MNINRIKIALRCVGSRYANRAAITETEFSAGLYEFLGGIYSIPAEIEKGTEIYEKEIKNNPHGLSIGILLGNAAAKM